MKYRQLCNNEEHKQLIVSRLSLGSLSTPTYNRENVYVKTLMVHFIWIVKYTLTTSRDDNVGRLWKEQTVDKYVKTSLLQEILIIAKQIYILSFISYGLDYCLKVWRFLVQIQCG